jgi:hypothetical protein
MGTNDDSFDGGNLIMNNFIFESGQYRLETVPDPPNEALRLQLVAILTGLSVGEQHAFASPANAVKQMLWGNNISGAQELIATYPLFGDADLEAVRTQLLACFSGTA